MTIQPTVLPSPAVRHVGPPTRILDVVWVGGTEDYIAVNRFLGTRNEDDSHFPLAVRKCIAIYIRGPAEPHSAAWRELFGSSWAFRKATEMTLGFASIPREPHLFRLWSADDLIVKVTSHNYDQLLTLFHGIEEDAENSGFEVVSCGFGPRGLLYTISH